MKKSIKKIAVTALALMMVLSMTACSGGDKGASSAPASAAASSEAASSEAASSEAASSEGTPAPAGDALSEADYTAKVTEIFNSITKISQDATANMDPSDLDATVAATKKMVEDVKPLYTELGALVAPEKFAAEQAKIADGCTASLELLDLSVELMDMQGADADDPEAQAKIKEVQEKTAALQTKAADMQSALTTVMGAAQ